MCAVQVSTKIPFICSTAFVLHDGRDAHVESQTSFFTLEDFKVVSLAQCMVAQGTTCLRRRGVENGKLSGRGCLPVSPAEHCLLFLLLFFLLLPADLAIAIAIAIVIAIAIAIAICNKLDQADGPGDNCYDCSCRSENPTVVTP